MGEQIWVCVGDCVLSSFRLLSFQSVLVSRAEVDIFGQGGGGWGWGSRGQFQWVSTCGSCVGDSVLVLFGCFRCSLYFCLMHRSRDLCSRWIRVIVLKDSSALHVTLVTNRMTLHYLR